MLRRPGSIKLFDLFGIRIGVDRSWFLILFLMIFWLSGLFRSALRSSDAVAYATTVVTVLVLFGSLIIHELGHALVARREGIEVRRIDLFLFGGMTQMGRDASTPGEEFKVAAAGPFATFLFVLVCLGIDLALVGPHRLMHAAELDGTVKITPVLLSLSWLLFWNVLLLGFNLIPAFPLDGGTDRARGDLAGNWRKGAGHARGGPDGRGVRTGARGHRRVAAALIPQLQRALAGGDLDPALPVGAGRAGPIGFERAHRGREGERRDGSPAGGDPRDDGRSARR